VLSLTLGGGVEDELEEQPICEYRAALLFFQPGPRYEEGYRVSERERAEQSRAERESTCTLNAFGLLAETHTQTNMQHFNTLQPRGESKAHWHVQVRTKPGEGTHKMSGGVVLC
jgi:hypothetical protein